MKGPFPSVKDFSGQGQKGHHPQPPAPQAQMPPQKPQKSARDQDEELMDRFEAQANRLFPMVSQGDQRTKFIVDQMNAAADRKQGNSYSIRVR
jgi:hypothetical protein